MVRIHLKRLLEDRQMTVKQLARMLNISQPKLNEYYHELNERISMELLSNICSALSCEISELLEYVPEKNPEWTFANRMRRLREEQQENKKT